ncbi:MAG: ABC transporter permease subunit [Spirochaetota bacterium]
MKGLLPVFKREFQAAFNSPVAYGIIIAFLIFTSAWLYFVSGFFAVGLADLSPYFGLMPIVLAFIIPALTMRSWAEEVRLGTAELLLTLPFGELEIVLGKFLASWALVAVAILLGLPVPITASIFGRFDPGVLFGQYLGVLLVAAAATAIGQWVSSRARNQVSAFLGTTLLLLALVLVDRFGSFLGAGGLAANLVNWLSLARHYEAFARGVLDSRDLAYYLVVTFFFLYLTAWTIGRRKWS